MTEKKGTVVGFADRKEIKSAEDKPIEINDHLVGCLEELMQKVLDGDVTDCIILPKHNDCGGVHPVISTMNYFDPLIYYALTKMPDVYEMSFVEEYEE